MNYLKDGEVFAVEEKDWEQQLKSGGWKPLEAPKPPDYIERRKKKDWIVKAVPVISVIGWLSAFVSLSFLDAAQPAKETFWSSIYSVRIVSFWNPLMLQLSLIMAVEVFLVCLLGFMFNLMRHRRKTDRFSKSILILWPLSVFYIAYLLIRFGYLIF